MPGRAKCKPGCDCEKHNRPRMSPEEARIRRQEISRRHYEQNREAILEQQRQLRLDPVLGEEKRRRERERMAALSPEEKARRAQLNRDWYQRNPRTSAEAARQHLMHRYRLTPERREEMIAAQDGRCYLCSEPLDLGNPRKVHIDHDHDCCRGSTSCGTCIRGIACDPCNRGIGYFGNDPDRLRRVADSLEMATRRLRDVSTPVRKEAQT
jgi:Recombination endonuclease VII